MPKLCFVYYSRFTEFTDKYLQECGWFGEGHKQTRKNMVERSRHTFYKAFLKYMSGDYLDNYYFFILADKQIGNFEETLKNYDLEKYIYYKQEKLSCNKNHGPTPRLRSYILKFQKDFQPQVPEGFKE